MKLSKHANWILWALVLKSRLLTAEQIGRWLGVSPERAKGSARPLIKARLVVEVHLRAQLLGPLERPLLRVRSGNAVVNPGRISWQAKNRYCGIPTRDVSAFTATSKGAALFGLPPRKPVKPEHASHDLGCAEMFLFALRHWPRLTTLYYEMEDIYAAERADVKFAKVEDARLYRQDRTMVVFEYAGRYSTERVRSFVSDMRDRELPFFLM